MSKFQYDVSTLQGNALPYLQQYINSVNRRCSAPLNAEDKELTDVKALIAYIREYRPTSVLEVFSYAVDNGMYSAYRRNASTFGNIIKEMQQPILRAHSEFKKQSIQHSYKPSAVLDDRLEFNDNNEQLQFNPL